MLIDQPRFRYQRRPIRVMRFVCLVFCRMWKGRWLVASFDLGIPSSIHYVVWSAIHLLDLVSFGQMIPVRDKLGTRGSMIIDNCRVWRDTLLGMRIQGSEWAIYPLHTWNCEAPIRCAHDPTRVRRRVCILLTRDERNPYEWSDWAALTGGRKETERSG